jgi:hypothetical protein
MRVAGQRVTIQFDRLLGHGGLRLLFGCRLDDRVDGVIFPSSNKQRNDQQLQSSISLGVMINTCLLNGLLYWLADIPSIKSIKATDAALW